LLFSGVEHDPGSETVAEPVRQVAQAAEVPASDSLSGLDLDTDNSADRMLQHHTSPIAKFSSSGPCGAVRSLARSSDMPMSLPPSPESVTNGFVPLGLAGPSHQA
jgi:hypothetical protein